MVEYDASHEELVAKDVDGELGYARPDPWRYRFGGPHPLIAGLVVQHLKEGPNRILEIGVAEGWLASRIIGMSEAFAQGMKGEHQKYVKTYAGMELSGKAVEECRIRVQGTPKRFAPIQDDLVQGDASDLTNMPGRWFEEQFDVVLVSIVIPYFPRERRELYTRKLYNTLLRPGGHLVMATWMSHEFGRSYHGDWPRQNVRAEGKLMVPQWDYEHKTQTMYPYEYLVVEKSEAVTWECPMVLW